MSVVTRKDNGYRNEYNIRGILTSIVEKNYRELIGWDMFYSHFGWQQKIYKQCRIKKSRTNN